MPKLLNAKNKIGLLLVVIMGLLWLNPPNAQAQSSTQQFLGEYQQQQHKHPSHHKHKVKLTAIPILIYQKVFSEQISASCLYELTCSRFGQQAIQEFGIIKGFFMALDRISRCNKLAAEDIHPVRLYEHTKVHDVPAMYHIHP